MTNNENNKGVAKMEIENENASVKNAILSGEKTPDNKINLTPSKIETKTNEQIENEEEKEELHENSVKLMTPMQMVLRRFFRSKLSIVGLVMIVALFLFCWLGPVIYNKWDSTEVDKTGRVEYSQIAVKDENGNVLFYQVVETGKTNNFFAKPDKNHPMGTDKNGRDVFARLMVGGRISLAISFLSVFAITLLKP